jgi:tRNA (cmo5U34)-methyltransferase
MALWMAAEAATFIAELAAELTPRAQRLLELGCRDGDLALRLLKVFPGGVWKGYERDAELAEQAAARLELMGSGMSIVQEDFRQASLGTGFDLAVSAWGLLGLAPEERERVLHKVHGALASGGAFIFSDAVRPPSAGIAAAYRARERKDLASEGLARDVIERQMEADSRLAGLCSVEEEMYRLRKAAFREVDLAWRCWDRAVFAALK